MIVGRLTGGLRVESIKEAEITTDDGSQFSNWLRVSRDVVEGLHILLLSARSDWLVRRELQVELRSRSNAEQRYEADIDLSQVEAGLPRVVRKRKEAGKPIWLPVLRSPAIRPVSLRVVQAFDGQNNALPVMPQAQIRTRLAAALTWLYLNGCYNGPTGGPPHLSEIANLQYDIEQAIYNHLTTGDLVRSARPPGRSSSDHLTNALAHLTRLAEATRTGSFEKRDPQEQLADRLTRSERTFADCLEYARSGHLTVIGITTEDRTPRIRCDLLPAELQVTTRSASEWPARILGLDLSEEPPSPSVRNRVANTVERLLAALTGLPLSYHFEFPVSEVADLDRTHVTIHADEEVALTPSVLHHDFLSPRGTGEGRRPEAQSYRLTSWASILIKTLRSSPEAKTWSAAENLEAVRAVATDQLRVVDRALRGRIDRFQAAQNLMDDGTRDLPILIEAREAKDSLERLLKILESDAAAGDDSDADEGLALLDELARYLDDNPHLELVADDDPRDHVAHFHVAEAHSMGQRDRDRRPVVHGILRASTVAREGYMRSAELTCLISTALLWLVAAVLIGTRATGSPYSGDGLVTVLLLVPAISATLMARVPGDSMRFLVVGRMARWTIWSLVPPSLVAIGFATFLQERGDEPTPAAPLFVVLGVGALASTLVFFAARANRRLHGNGFSFGAPVAGLVTYRSDSRQHLLERGDRYHSVVDMRSVVDLCSAALFRVDRPARRFMVWLTLDGDSPGNFARIVDALEDSPDDTAKGLDPEDEDSRLRNTVERTKSIWSRVRETAYPDQQPAERERESGPVSIESSAVQTVGTTGAVMAILSGDRNILPQDQGEAQTKLASLLGEQLHDKLEVDELTFKASPDDGGHDPVVREIVEDRDYFLYKVPRFADAVFLVAEDRRDDLADIVVELSSIENRLFSISYLHCPIGCVERDSVKWATLKLGLSFDREYAPVMATAMLRLYTIAKKHGAVFEAYDRRVYDDPTTLPSASAGSTVPVVAVSAGRSDDRMTAELLKHMRAEIGATWRGGSVLSAGGYTCRTFLFDVAEGASTDMTFSPASSENDTTDDLVWRLKRLENVQAPAADADGFVLWVRWHLRGDALSDLLNAVQRWSTTVDQTHDNGSTSAAMNDLMIADDGVNLEYLNNRVDDLGMIDGKARYRITLQARETGVRRGDRTPESRRQLEAAYRRSLYARLEMTLRERIGGEGFVVVSDQEPHRPSNSDERLSEFVPY